MIVVSNTSPIISLARIEQLKLLNQLFAEILIAGPVYSELVAQPASALELNSTPWIKVHELTDNALLAQWRKQFRLGRGELSTILLAKELSVDLAIIDEKKARQLAQRENLRVVGTLGILEESYRRKHIHDLRMCYQSLLSTGTYIDRRLLNMSLQIFELPDLE